MQRFLHIALALCFALERDGWRCQKCGSAFTHAKMVAPPPRVMPTKKFVGQRKRRRMPHEGSRAGGSGRPYFLYLL